MEQIQKTKIRTLYPIEITYFVDVKNALEEAEEDYLKEKDRIDYLKGCAEEGIEYLMDDLGHRLGSIKKIIDEGFGYHERLFSVNCVIYVDAENEEEAERIAFNEQDMLAGFSIANKDDLEYIRNAQISINRY